MKKPFTMVGKTKDMFAEFSRADLERIEVALRLRQEAASENKNRSESYRWFKTRRKILFLLEWKE